MQDENQDENHLPLGDETYTIVVNSKASGSVPIPPPLQALFQYMNDSEVAVDNDLIRRIDHSVETWNSREGRRIIMTFEQELLIRENKAREEGLIEGREEGRNEGHTNAYAEIVCRMHDNGKSGPEISRDTGLSESDIDAILQQRLARPAAQ